MSKLVEEWRRVSLAQRSALPPATTLSGALSCADRLRRVLRSVDPLSSSFPGRCRPDGGAVLKFLKEWLRFTKMASPPVEQGGGVMPRSVDFLVAEGSLRVQECRGMAAGFAGTTFCAVEDEARVQQGPLCNFFVLLNFSVKILV